MHQKTPTEESSFRSSSKWTHKSLHIRERDSFLCQACLHGLDGTRRITTEHLEVHHIRPLCDSWDDRLNDDNLITLCREHHEAAEQGAINVEVLEQIARANTDRQDGKGCDIPPGF